jgi:metal-responsive CopG/Arc/MetJ family transcriptional regulator
MNNKKLKITRKTNDEYKTFSIRIKTELVDQIDAITNKTNRSRNELIETLLNFAVENIEIED